MEELGAGDVRLRRYIEAVEARNLRSAGAFGAHRSVEAEDAVRVEMIEPLLLAEPDRISQVSSPCDACWRRSPIAG